MKVHATIETTPTESVWARTKIASRPPLRSSVTTDVCVVGAGIAGLTTAYLLAKEGRNVVLVDDGEIAGGQTQVTTAHLASVIDDRFVELERVHGEHGARLAAESHAAAIDQIETIVAEEKIVCDFARVDGYLFAPPEDESDLLDREFEAAERTGVLRVSWLDRAPWPHFDTGPCLRFANQGQFHPLKYLKGVAEAFERLGGKIHCSTHVSTIEGGSDAHVETEGGGRVTANHVVVATNSPINDMVAIHTKQAPYISYVVALRSPAGLVQSGLYWDLADPYHYVRTQRAARSGSDELLLVGGEDHKTGQADDGHERFLRLEAWARERFPFLKKIEFRWSGQVMETIDGLAFIGRNPMDDSNVYIATGDSGMGMTHGTIAGMLLTDLIVNRPNPWEKLYEPLRKPLRSLGRFSSENLNVAVQYGAWLTPGEVRSTDEIPRGGGAILRHAMRKLAVCRDDDGKLTAHSAVCPHLNCIVAWNDTERTWDCPCHGSRFSAEGKVLNGPANVDLANAELPGKE